MNQQRIIREISGEEGGNKRYICVKITRNHACLLSLFPIRRVLDFRRAKDNWLNPTGMYKNIRVPCILSQKSWVASRTSLSRKSLDRFTTCFDAFLIRKQILLAIRYNVTCRALTIASLFLFRLSMRIRSRVKVLSCLPLSNSPKNTSIPDLLNVASVSY